MFGIYSITIFGLDLSLPVGGWNGGALRNMILPVAVLALPQIAIIARLVRGSTIEVLRSNYVRTALRQGPRRISVVMVRHVLRYALLPLVSYLGPAIAGAITELSRRGADFRIAGHRPLFRARRPQPRLLRW